MTIRNLIEEMEEGEVLHFTDPEGTICEVHCNGEEDYDFYDNSMSLDDPLYVYTDDFEGILGWIYDEGDFEDEHAYKS